jgi:hypothetical protein
MKHSSALVGILLLAVASSLQAAPMGTAFNYQGKLSDGTNAVTGLYDFQFSLWDAVSGGAQSGSTVPQNATPVTNGLFNVTLDFGSSVFSGSARWLQVSVRTNGAGGFSTLSPRQPIAPTPYALYSANAALLGGQTTNAFAPAAGSPTYVAKSGDTMTGRLTLPLNGLTAGATQLVVTAGAVGIGTSAPTDALLDVEGDMHLNEHDLFLRGGTDRNHGLGWYGLLPNTNKYFAGIGLDGPALYGWSGGGLGSMNGGQRLSLQWNNLGNVWVDPGASNNGALTPGLSFGPNSGEGIASQRTAGDNQYGLDFYTIYQRRMTIANNGDLHVQGVVDTIGSNPLEFRVNGEGALRLEPTMQAPNVVGGYAGNSVVSGVVGATIGGGGDRPLIFPPHTRIYFNNTVSDSYAVVAGGSANSVNGFAGVISGGQNNTVATNAQYAVVPGGDLNWAGGINSFAAGHRAKANNDGTFVWADTTDADFGSTGNNQFLIRASGGVGIGTANPTAALEVSGTAKATTFQGDGSGLVNVPGTAAWQTLSGGSVTATPNSGYIAQGPNLLTLLLPASPAVGTMVNVLGAGSGGWRVNANVGQSFNLLGGGGGGGGGAGAWVARDSSRNWTAVASSSDGTKLVASATTGLYTSTDSGVTWVPHETTRNWAAVASSSDGTKLVAGSLNEYGGYVDGYIYTSTSSGGSWTQRTQSGNWLQIASSADGTRLIAIDIKPDFSNQLFVSADSGINWTVSVAWPSAPMFQSVASAADGITMMAAVYGGRIYFRTNTLNQWYPRGPSQSWRGVACSSDASKLVAVAYGGQIYTSTDYGTNWVARDSNRNWTCVASSSDGAKLIAAVSAGQIYTSVDGGASWTPSESNRNWISVASSGDGNKLVAAVNGGQLYTYVPPTSGGGGMGGGMHLVYIGSGIWVPVSTQGTITWQ